MKRGLSLAAAVSAAWIALHAGSAALAPPGLLDASGPFMVVLSGLAALALAFAFTLRERMWQRRTDILSARLGALDRALHAETTKRASALERLRTQETWLSQAARLAGLGFAIFDARTGRFDYCSPHMARAFRMTPEQFLSRVRSRDDFLSLVHPEDRDALRAACDGLADGVTRDLQFRIGDADGNRWIRELCRPELDADGRLIRVLCAIVDFTQHHETVEHDAQAQRMQSLGRMSGGVAHDFNNLLTVILGNADLLREVGDSGAQAEMLEEIAEATRRGRDLTRNMLGFARGGGGAPARSLDLNRMVQEMAPLLERTLPANVALEFDLADTLPPARADRSLTDSALMNLTLNARDAMADGGTLTIATSLRSEDGGDVVALDIRDTGTGMTPEVRERLFEPFFSTKRPDTNTGLGLSMVRSMVEEVGGRIEVDSTPGEGSRFRILLPAAFPADTWATGAEAVATTRAPLSVLLTEDDPAVRRALSQQLHAMGHKVTEAADADVARSVFDVRGPFDLLLCDLVLPGPMQGPALAGALLARRPGLKVIFLTAYPGADAPDLPGPVLHKPASRAELQAALAATMTPQAGQA